MWGAPGVAVVLEELVYGERFNLLSLPCIDRYMESDDIIIAYIHAYWQSFGTGASNIVLYYSILSEDGI